MSSSRYTLAGWLAISQAIIFPLAFVISIAQTAIGVSAFGFQGPMLGPSDILFLIFTGISIYTLLMFRNLLNERFNYHGINTLIIISIWLGVLFQFGLIGLKGFHITLAPLSDTAFTIVNIVFISIGMIVAGIVDIFIAVKLLKIRESLSNLIKVFAYITMITGICELTVILSPLVLGILMPVIYILLGIIFLQEKEEVEFV
ncbi:MAG: hypothetical protein GY855_02585 [candidate division Zixibacteria bacterium]|nr:hypothetical protein [candidate division Zixibacteria bacterium]